MLLRAWLSGSVSTTRTPYNPVDGPIQPGAPRAFGPAGYYFGPPQYGPSIQGCGAQLRVQYAGSGTQYAIPCAPDGGTDATDSSQGFLFAQGSGSALRTVAAPGSGCTYPGVGTGPCFYYSGSQTATIERVTAELDLTAAPTTVNYNDTVTVTASITPAQVGGLNVPWSIDSVRWVPAFGTQNSPCSWNLFVPNTGDAPSRTCRRPFTRSGTLTVSATVNGDVKQQSVAIVVTRPTLKVTASPAAIAGAQAVTFTASVTPSSVTWNVATWTWRPDTGAVGSGISPNNCVWTEKVCTRTISKPGWMKATATVGEYTLADSARIRRIPCPTGDSIGDLQAVRQALNDALQASNASAPDFQNRRELPGLLLRNLQTGNVEVVRFDQFYSDWCASNYKLSFNPQTHRLLGVFHTHPFSAGDIVAYCPKLEVDETTGLLKPVEPPASNPGGIVQPGGSALDWTDLDDLNNGLREDLGVPEVDSYVIGTDFIYRLNHGQNPSFTRIDYKTCPNWLN